MWVGLRVALHVQREVVGSTEGTLAEVAGEGFLPGVLAVVAGELVAAGEFPRAAVP